MPEMIGDQKSLARQRQSWLLVALFAGMGTGFIIFWVTLAILNASVLCAIISLVIWPLSRDKGGSNFATTSAITFFVATIIGIFVGVASTAGTGL